MPLNIAELLWTRAALNGAVKVRWGKVVTGLSTDLVAAAGDRFYIFTPSGGTYALISAFTVGEEILSLAVGLPSGGQDSIIIGLADRVLVYRYSQGTVIRILETQPEPGSRFVDLAVADIDGDAREEIIAASEGGEVFFVYGIDSEQFRLSLLAIRSLPGPAQKVTVLARAGETVPAIASAYKLDSLSGIAIFIFTERGFQEGPALQLEAVLTSLAGGEFRPRPGEELAWGGNDGLLRIVEVNSILNTVVVSENLGSSVLALTAGNLPGDSSQTLIAGTPEGFLFGFPSPVSGTKPDWAVRTGRPVNDLDISGEGLLGLGTADGGVQVWFLAAGGRLVHTVRPGETLSAIAALYNRTAAVLAATNNIANPDLIFPGRRLLIP